MTNPTRTGCEFLGWTGSNGNTPQTSVTIANGNPRAWSDGSWSDFDTSAFPPALIP